MENTAYLKLHALIKITSSNLLSNANSNAQISFSAHAIANSKERFRIIQNRKGHKNKENLSYVLFHKQTDIMVRVDLNGAAHNGLPTPHIHIFDEAHQNGKLAIPLDNLDTYVQSDDLTTSFLAFLTYNQFDTQNNYFSSITQRGNNL